MYQPWYLRRRFPVFCFPCIPFYSAVRPARKCLLILSLCLWLSGALTLIAVIVTCTALSCTNYIAIFVSLACVLIWLGYALFHCAWASFLLRDEGGTSVAQKGAGNDVLLQVEAAAAVDGPAGQTENYDPKNTGYWKFVDDEPWQVKCNRNELR